MKIPFSPAQIQVIKEALPSWCEQYAYACILNSNAIASACNHDSYELIAGVAGKDTKTFTHTETIGNAASWKLGYITYEYNLSQHGLIRVKESPAGFRDCFFFEPQILLIIKRNSNEIEITGATENIIEDIFHFKSPEKTKHEIKLKARVTKEEYISNVERIKEQITEGDYYELNYCMEFYSEDAGIDPVHTFQALNKISPTPFASYVKEDSNYLLCASPERFLKKEGRKIIAQPMKGTIQRNADPIADEVLKLRLLHSEKERAENTMIVDLMRNDLAQCAETGSVKVEELLGIYSFATVHQMISTVTATLRKEISFNEILSKTFPMGSMTGAPKRAVMHAINNYEPVARGIFSGSAGYISPDNDFDFNVVIRSIVYDKKNKYVSCHVGSAITYDADAEEEYNECLLKTKTMFAALGVIS